MGKTVIRASDGPGFLVNRCNRPFGLEALRLLQERIADIETIDRICRMEGGFRMGPFELMDLVGVDTGFEISKSFYEQSFGEPRWRPSPIAARYVAAGLHGRKTGRGYYDYGDGGAGSTAPEDPPARRADATGRRRGRGGDLRRGVLAEELRDGGGARPAMRCARRTRRPAACCRRWRRLRRATARPRRRIGRARSAATAGRTAAERRRPCQGGARVVLCAQGSLGALDPGGSAVGFHVLPPFARGRAGRADAQRELLAAWRPRAPSASSARSASTSRGSATRRGWCSGGSSAR